MSSTDTMMKLALLLNLPKSKILCGSSSTPIFVPILTQYTSIVTKAEEAKLDFAFVADSVSGNVVGNKLPHLEPLTLLAALAAITKRVGLVATASTTFCEPYNLARQLLSLDHLSNGRAGWNIVVSSEGERNFGNRSISLHVDRYRRGWEFVEVVQKLWNSWEDDAVIQRDGQIAAVDPSKVHPIKHCGEMFSVEGPLPHARSPQGHPVLMQSGSSEDGKNFAAKFADAVYTAQPSLDRAQSFYADLKRRTRSAGRRPDQIKILPGVCTVIGDTEASALQLDRDILADAFNHNTLAALERQFNGVSLQDLGADDIIPKERLPDASMVQGRRSRYSVFYECAVTKRFTLRQLAKLLVGSNGHARAVGSATQVADFLENWFKNGGADGFVVMPGQGPGGDDIFLEQVVPILQKRGLFRNEYEAETLRGNFGLGFPSYA